ncbi:hypothetical protein LTR94_023347 [Friedmanniomyces endolithicus]|nr:hypothetical protein LTR94_023347 [Friedmanniomyces endolithicus]
MSVRYNVSRLVLSVALSTGLGLAPSLVLADQAGGMAEPSAGSALVMTHAATSQAVDPQAAAETRARQLVSQMTLEEKAGQIQHGAPAIPRLGVPAYNWWNEGLHGVARADIATVFPQVIGMAATWDPALIEQVADTVATEFRAKYLDTRQPDGGSAQYRGLTVWSPNINIFRDPRWGRGQETWGEDPYLTGRFGVAYIRGLQGADPLRPKTIAAVKHYAVHSGPEASRHSDDIHPSAYDVTDTYLPAFHAAVTEAKPQALMCAYNAIDGLPACANADYLQDRLRNDWGFDGHVVSDCAAVADIYLPTSHATVKTPEEAVALAMKAGTDLICDFRFNATFQPQTTVRAVQQGLLTEQALDQTLVRLFTARYRLGTMDLEAGGPYAAIRADQFDTPQHRQLALDVARKSLVLLKNDGLLPLAQAPRKIAVIGPNADTVDALVGNYNGTPSNPSTILGGLRARFPEAEVAYVEGTGWVAPPLEDIADAAFCLDEACSQPGLRVESFETAELDGSASERTDANVAIRWGWPDREARNASTRWSGYVRAPEAGDYRFRYTGDAGYRVYIDDELIADMWDGAWPTSDRSVLLSSDKTQKITVEAQQIGVRASHRLQWSRPSVGDGPALAAARDADLVVFAAGLTSKFEGEEIVNWADENLPAIIEAWYPGGDGGQAVAELIAGDFSPSGRLPLTFYRSVEDLPAFTDYGMKGRTYRYYRGEPLYQFGHGLSFSKFAYSNAKLSSAVVRAGDAVRVEVDVANVGSRDADEVAQLYVTLANAGDEGPVRSLVGFERVHLKVGETRRVAFEMPSRALSAVMQGGRRRIDPGQVSLWIGGGQPVTRAQAQENGVSMEFAIVGSQSSPAF